MKRLPDDLEAAHDDVPWRQISGMRDIVVHLYFALDTEIIGDAIQNDVPAPRSKIQAILDETPGE